MRLSFSLCCLVVAACSTNNPLANGVQGTVAVDAAPAADMTAAPDLAPPDYTGVACGADTCRGSKVCCIEYDATNMTAGGMCLDPGQCPDGGATAVCDGPEDCSSGDACCLAIAISSSGDLGTPSAGSGSASCIHSCPPAILGDLSSGLTVRTHLCHDATDCQGLSGSIPGYGTQAFNRCCHTPQAPNDRFCAPGLGAMTGYYDCAN